MDHCQCSENSSMPLLHKLTTRTHFVDHAVHCAGPNTVTVQREFQIVVYWLFLKSKLEDFLIRSYPAQLLLSASATEVPRLTGGL